MHSITDWLSGLSGPIGYAVVAGLVFVEDALFFSFVVPGETAAVLGGFLAQQGRVDLGWLVLFVVLAAILGDTAGYEIGRHLGPRLVDTRPMRRHAHRVEQARRLMRRRGPAAVFFGRFVAFFRAMVPTLAGMSRMPYRRFVLFNALGGLLWGVGFTLLGYFAGAAYTRVEGTVGRVLALVIGAFVVVSLAVWWFLRRRGSGDGDRSPARAEREGEQREAERREAERQDSERREREQQDGRP
ncbi:DedA family protein [Kitasatospora sp. NPDC057512]|uniref:DedA family protein n=1 Tax=Kitasatospora sp. NPDC057512 TaxID=3346154 RepID=UPI00367E742C